MKHIKIQLEPTPHGDNPYNVEVWDTTGDRWLFDLDVSQDYYHDATNEEIEKAMNQIVLAVKVAPDLLAACEMAYDFIDDHHHLLEPHVHTVLDEIEHVIAKAKGE